MDQRYNHGSSVIQKQKLPEKNLILQFQYRVELSLLKGWDSNRDLFHLLNTIMCNLHWIFCIFLIIQILRFFYIFKFSTSA